MALLDKLLFPTAFAAALGCGLVAGIFFAFSNFVMKALARVPDEHGMRAMQAINVTVLNPLFLTIFVGTAALCVFLGIISIVRWNAPGALSLVIGALLYLVGNFVVTIACNVPRNEALARLDASNPATHAEWRKYIDEWTRWNHVRTITAAAAAAAFVVAIYQQRGG
jgi:uncharacterized membrane protein